MGTIFNSQFLLGFAVGCGLWFLVYIFNRMWLAFWSIAR